MRLISGVAAAFAVAIVGMGSATPVNAQDATVNVGDRAPIFEGRADDGEIWRSRDHVGRSILVVYFYPGAMTSGCTTQACLFRDNRSVLQDLGAEVVGVSGDRIEGLKAFKGANQLNFPLVSDTAGVVARAFGVSTRAGTSMTREVNGQAVSWDRDITINRWTFIIDREGRVVFKDSEVNPAADSENVIAHIRRMAAGG